jgi:hypothetical protein
VLVHKPLVVNELMTRKIGLKSLNDPIDTTTPQGRLTFNLFASLAEYAEPAVMRSREWNQGQNGPPAPRIKPTHSRVLTQIDLSRF